jgi:hypothetical protein
MVMAMTLEWLFVGRVISGIGGLRMAWISSSSGKSTTSPLVTCLSSISYLFRHIHLIVIFLITY